MPISPDLFRKVLGHFANSLIDSRNSIVHGHPKAIQLRQVRAWRRMAENFLAIFYPEVKGHVTRIRKDTRLKAGGGNDEE